MGFEDQFIRNRVNMPTAKSSAEIARDIPAGIRARSFFSARVAEAHILERFRKITDDYNTGRIGRDEARNLMLEYARAHGKDDGTRGLKNLASTARLDLIVDQNAKMAHAVGEHERMYSESAMRVFPYVIYHASVGSKKPRSEHQKYDGMIFEKTDPWLKTHTPPWEFGCNCQLEQITAKRAGKTPERIQKPTPPDQVHVDSRSGFSFDPEHVFEKFELESIKSPEVRGEIREEAEIQLGDQVHFSEDSDKAYIKVDSNYKTFEEKNLKSCREWDHSNLPKYPALQSPNEAKQKLIDGITIKNPDGQKIIFGQKVLDHWEIKHKTEEDINGRLKRLNLGLETVKHPSEIWKQKTQTGYIQVFNKGSGKLKGCLVFVDHEGQAITYFPKDLKELDAARKGISVKVLSAPDAKQTAPVEDLSHPTPQLNRNKISPVSEKVKGDSSRNPEEIQKKMQNIAKTVSLDMKKGNLETIDQLISILNDRMGRFNIPKFDGIKPESKKGAVGGVLDNDFHVNIGVLKNSKAKWERTQKDAEKHDGYIWTFMTGPDDFIRSFVDHEIGHRILDRSGKMNLVASVFEKAGVSHQVLDRNGNPIRDATGRPIVAPDALQISRYANSSDPHEFFAECFNKYMSSRRNELPDYIRNMVEDVIKAAK